VPEKREDKAYSGTSASRSSGSTVPRMPCLDFHSSILSFQLTCFFSSNFALPDENQTHQEVIDVG
jgi:hypothetical protein